MKTQQELRELKEELTNSVFSIGENEKSAPTAIIQTPIVTPDTTARKQIEAEDIESSLRIEDAEIERIKRALEVSGGNRKVAAAKLDISERTLYRKIKEYGL
jgi:transcriptional regulator with PAS, ATPase and Fis domain